MRTHSYRLTLDWTGNLGSGTSGYRAYSRNHSICAPGKSAMAGSSDPAFLGDAARWNPEQLLLASLSACHQLWYLHLASEAGIIVTAYRDDPEGTMIEEADGGGRFDHVLLHPTVTVDPCSDEAVAMALHEKAHHLCFIARSVNFTVECEGKVER